MKTDKRYWYVLLIPVVAIIAIVVFLIPRNKHHDWDDEEEEEEERVRTERSDFDITEEDIAAIPEGEPPVWGGNSPAVHEEPVPGIVIDARENTFDHPTTVKFRPATTEEHKELSKAISKQLPSHSLLFAFDLDAGIEPMHRAPGNFSVELDLEKLDIPEELWGHLCVCRLDESGIVQQYSRTLSDDGIFRFESSKNCLWAITFAGLIITSGAERACYLTALGALPRAATWLQLTVEYGDKFVELTYDDKRTGQFTVGFNPYDTEHPDPAKYLKGMKRMDRLADSLRTRAQIELSEERMQERNPAFQQWPNRNAINYNLRLNTLLQEMIRDNYELQKLLNDTTYKTPQSIENISMMIRYAKVYLKDVERVKEPGEVSKFYLGSSTLSGGGDGVYTSWLDVCPMIAVNYKGRYVDGNKKVQTGTLVEDCMKVTIAHELFHHHQSAYVWFSLFRSKTWDECTASVIERSYAKWMYEQGKLVNDPAVKDLKFCDRDHKEWLFAPLDNSLIVPTGFDPTLVGQVYKKTGIKLMVDIKDLIKGNRPVNFEELERVLFESVTPLFPQLKRVEMMRDIFGYWEAGVQNYGNCDKGYMLGEFYEYIRDNYVPDARLHDFLMYGTGFTDMMFFTAGWNIANAFKEGFHVEDAFLSRAFNEYCQTVMKKTVERQKWLMSEGANAGNCYIYYRQQAFKPYLPVSRQQPIVKLQCWERAGMYACRTATLDPADSNDLYNLFLVSHMFNGKEDAVKPFVLRGDSAYSPTPYYLECDSNGMKSPTSVAFLFTDKMKGQSLSLAEYYDAVAFYAPRQKPSVEFVSGGGVRLKTYELPSDEMMRNNYVTGIAYTVKNNKTGRENTILKPLDSTEHPTIAIPDWQAGEEADISTYCRWYYKPYDNESTIYYSPKSDIVMLRGEAEDMNEVIIDQPICINRTLLIIKGSCLDRRRALEEGLTEEEINRINEECDREIRFIARLRIRKNGAFTLTIPSLSCNLNKNIREHHMVFTSELSAFSLEGQGRWNSHFTSFEISDAPLGGVNIKEKAHTHEKFEDYDEKIEAEAVVTCDTYSMQATVEDGKFEDFKLSFPQCHIKECRTFNGEKQDAEDDRERFIEGENE